MTDQIVFAPLHASHLPDAMRMSAACGWPHRIEDWAFVAGLSKGVVAMFGGRVVATALATTFGEVAMANLIIVDESLRGQGLGREIMCRAMADVTPAAWQLVATSDGLPLYEKLGFRTTGEIMQHQGRIISGLVSAADYDGVEWASHVDMDDIQQIDRRATGMDRRSLYQALQAAGRFAVLRRDGGIAGFAALRPFGRGEVAGPVVAQNTEEGQRLLSMILSAREGHFLRVDTDAQTGLSPWLAERGLVHVGGGVRMQKGERPTQPAGPYTVYGLASQALG